MSGGSWDYSYSRVQDIGERLSVSKEPERRAMAKSVLLLSVAMKAIEWVDSGDSCEGDDLKAIRAYLDAGVGADAAILEALTGDARDALARLAAALDRVSE
jgi:hypothetical protein